MPKVVCFYVTVPDENSAEQIITDLLGQRLIACGNFHQTKSIFNWENKLENTSEIVCILKTFKHLELKVQKQVEALHPYDVPLIARWSIKVNKPYYKWMETMLKN